MLNTIRKNYVIFDKLAFDMQKLKRDINKVDETFMKAKLDGEQYFENMKIKFEDNKLIESHSILDIKLSLNEYIKNFEDMKLEHDEHIKSIIEKLQQTKFDILDFIDTYKDYDLVEE